MTRLIPLLALLLGCAASASEVSLGLNEVDSPSLLLPGEAAGRYRPAPLLALEADIRVTGPIARTTLVQEFRNPGSEWVEALYAFPLPEDAAVDHLRMVVGERIIIGEIQEREQARATYAEARAAGQKAALVEQQRPNLFTTAVANIPPAGRVRIEIEYQQQLRWRDGEFSLRFPLAITPRYSPTAAPQEQHFDLENGWSLLPGELPNAADLSGRVQIPAKIRLDIRPGFAVDHVSSPSHPIIQRQQDGRITVQLADGPVRADRDFRIAWRPRPGAEPQAAFFTETTAQGDFGLLLLTPPQRPARLSLARELILVIDTSGSMGGEPIRAAREALLRALDSLRPGDRFNLIQFNSGSEALFRAPVAADPGHLEQARRYVRRLDAGGGTNMQPALQRALAKDHDIDSGVLRQIVFVTDGAVANEAQLFGLIHQKLGDDRLFTVGIGSAPNTWFMSEAARAGRGSYTTIARVAEVEQRMEALFRMLESPVLTSLQLDLPEARESLPDPIPDLYAGEPIQLVMRLDGPPAQARLRGRLGQQPWSAQLDLAGAADQAGIGVLWARQKIAHYQRQGTRGMDAGALRERILALALDHHLVSPYTSLVAVDRTPARPAEAGLDSHALKGELPAGISVPTVSLAAGATASPLWLLLAALLLLLALSINAIALGRSRPRAGYKPSPAGVLPGVWFLGLGR